MPPLAKPQNYVGTITKIVRASPRVKIFTFSLDKPDFTFTPGQNVVLSIPGFVNDEGAPVKRVYSIASSPNDPLELCIAILPNGTISQKLDKMKTGDTLTIQGPYGAYQLQNPTEAINLIAGGTGIAPLISILRHLLKHNQETKITLYFGFRNEEDFLYRTELEGYASRGWLTLHTASSGETDWPTKGRITTLVKQHIVNAPTYICGPQPLVTDTRKILEEKGFSTAQIMYEAW